MLGFWSYFLRRHDWVGTGLHVVLFTASLVGACIFSRLARATLRGEARKPFMWSHVWRDLRTYKTIAACAFLVIFYLISASAIKGIPRYFYLDGSRWWTEGTKGPDPTVGAYNLRRLVARSLESIGVSPFANLRRQDVSTKPPNWTGDVKEYASVKGGHLRKANMQYADAYQALLVNADISGARLSNAELSDANLANADLSYANLANADLSHANLNGVDLRDAKGLSKSQLNKAKTDEHTLVPRWLPAFELPHEYASPCWPVGSGEDCGGDWPRGPCRFRQTWVSLATYPGPATAKISGLGELCHALRRLLPPRKESICNARTARLRRLSLFLPLYLSPPLS